ncbi:unnamed protein product [Prorocentrum cordatum]|uniref:Uncharacterized protein n=1 Tax=Prorocentrum cordatum TaxID=2364126 RepID=A0ABN9TKK8_9DINO|nr:unnamed protein product [Polarella glacialis]
MPPEALLGFAASALHAPLRLESLPQPPAGYAEALASLSRRGVRLEGLFQDVAAALALCVSRGETALVERWLRQLLYTRVGTCAVWDAGIAQEFEAQLKDILQGVALPVVVSLAKILQDSRAHRVGLWRVVVDELRSRILGFGTLGAPCFDRDLLPQALDVVRRSPFRAATWPQGLAFAAAQCAGHSLETAPSVELARLLHAFHRLLAPPQFVSLVVRPHTRVLQARLADANQLGDLLPAVLHSLANGGGRSAAEARWPTWWRGVVIRPWAAQLRRLTALLLDAGPVRGGGRAAYLRSLRGFRLSDVGEQWILPVSRGLGLRAPPGRFVRTALRSLLRRRRRVDAASPWAQRALGFAAWSLRSSVDGRALSRSDGQLTFSVAKEVGLEEHAADLLSADVGFLDKTYRRHGDVERAVLLSILRDLGEHAGAEGRRHVTGNVDIFVDRVTCISCLGVLVQFRRLLPRVCVRVACALPPLLSRHLGYSRYFGVARASPRDTSLAPVSAFEWDP